MGNLPAHALLLSGEYPVLHTHSVYPPATSLHAPLVQASKTPEQSFGTKNKITFVNKNDAFKNVNFKNNNIVPS